MIVEFTIRDAEYDDAYEIAEIENACFSMPWSKKLIEAEICSDIAVFLVARDTEGLLLGYVSGRLVTDEFYISNIAVREECRRLGVGSALLQQLIDIVQEQQCAFVTLEVRVSNVSARKMYERFGFVPVGERKDYYQYPTENALIYTLYLNTPEAEDEDISG